MTGAADFARIDRKLRAVEKVLDDPEALNEAGKKLKKLPEKAAEADIGDNSMSAWRRGKPIPLQARYDVEDRASLVIKPTPRSRGPWRVMEDGRQAAGAGTLRSGGIRRRKSDGVLSTRLRVRRRTVGAMAGKDTWSDAERMVFDEAPRLISEAKVKQIRAIFR